MRALDESGALAGNPAVEAKWTRPPRRSGVDLERVAQVYLDAVRSGGKPLEAVRRLGPMSQSAAAKQVSRAARQRLYGKPELDALAQHRPLWDAAIEVGPELSQWAERAAERNGTSLAHLLAAEPAAGRGA